MSFDSLTNEVIISNTSLDKEKSIKDTIKKEKVVKEKVINVKVVKESTKSKKYKSTTQLSDDDTIELDDVS